MGKLSGVAGSDPGQRLQLFRQLRADPLCQLLDLPFLFQHEESPGLAVVVGRRPARRFEQAHNVIPPDGSSRKPANGASRSDQFHEHFVFVHRFSPKPPST